MRCQEEEEEEEEGDHVPGLGTREGSTLLFSTTARFCDIKQRRNCSFLTSISIAITSLTIRSSGVLLETGRVFLMRFIVGVKPIWKLAKLPIKARHYSRSGPRGARVNDDVMARAHFLLDSTDWDAASVLVNCFQLCLLLYHISPCDGWKTCGRRLIDDDTYARSSEYLRRMPLGFRVTRPTCQIPPVKGKKKTIVHHCGALGLIRGAFAPHLKTLTLAAALIRGWAECP